MDLTLIIIPILLIIGVVLFLYQCYVSDPRNEEEHIRKHRQMEKKLKHLAKRFGLVCKRTELGGGSSLVGGTPPVYEFRMKTGFLKHSVIFSLCYIPQLSKGFKKPTEAPLVRQAMRIVIAAKFGYWESVDPKKLDEFVEQGRKATDKAGVLF